MQSIRDRVSTSGNRRSENIGVLTVVVAELELGNIERKVLFADLVEATHDTTLDQRPEAFDCLGVNRADDVLAFGVVNGRVRIDDGRLARANAACSAALAPLVFVLVLRQPADESFVNLANAAKL